jgi:signal transduction histidine kinase
VSAALYLVAMALSLPYSFGSSQGPGWITVPQDISLFSLALIPVACGIAILRHRLFDIDVVINRTLVYGSLAAFITAVYVVIVVGLGAAVGRGAAGPNLGLSILATAVIAVAFGPVKERVQHVANRLVYGKRATPYEVLSDFSARLAGTYGTEDLLPRMSRTLAEATGASSAEVWLKVGGELHREACWPASDPPPAPVAMPGGSLPVPDGASLAEPVVHSGELLGCLIVTKPGSERATPADQKVTSDLASQVGLVLRNVRLVEDLRASRQRIVAAQDLARRRLERNIHDGAQQDLVTLALAARMAEHSLAGTDPKVAALLREATDELRTTLAELRELARGIHPAVLTEQGLSAALDSLAERSLVPTTVACDVRDRLPPTVEATAYYAVSEALQNVQKYAGASAVRVSAERRDGHLRVRVVDDGVGGADPSRGSGIRGLSDRVAAVNGSLAVESPSGGGTSLTVELPCG